MARASWGELAATVYSLEPDEAPEARTDTRLQGVALEWSRSEIGKAGLSWFTVPRSQAIYPGDLAPLDFIDDGRDGLDTWHGWVNVTGVLPAAPTLVLRAAFAQRRTRRRRRRRRKALRPSARPAACCSTR